MLADNSHHLIEAARRRHSEAYQRVEDTIRTAHAAGETLSVTAVSTRAGVSRAFVYAQPELADAARKLAPSRTSHLDGQRSERASDASQRTKMAAVTQRNKELRQENQDLRRRLEAAHGRLRDQAASAPADHAIQPDPKLVRAPTRSEEVK